MDQEKEMFYDPSTMHQVRTRGLVRFSVDHPWLIIIAAVLVSVVSVFQLTRLTIEPDVESLLPGREDSSESPSYSGEFDRLAVLVRGDDLFTLAGLERFDAMINELASGTGAADVVTPFNTVTLDREAGRLSPVLMADGGRVPRSGEELQRFRRRLEADPFAAGLTATGDGSGLVAYLLVPKGESYLELDGRIRDITDAYRSDFAVNLTGSIPFSAETERYLTRDASRLMALVVLTILLSYYLGFRTLRAMILPVVLVSLATLWSMGLMGVAGWRLTMVSIVSPPLVLTLGSSYSIHILSEYYRTSLMQPDRKKAVVSAVSSVSGTVVMASATTIVGLSCLLLASIPQTRQFAVATAAGVAASALLSLTLFPALLVLQKPISPRKLERVSSGTLTRLLSRLGTVIVRYRMAAILVLAVIAGTAGYLTPRVAFNTSPPSYFPADAPVIGELEAFSAQVGGLDEIVVTLEAPPDRPGYFLETESLEIVHAFDRALAADPDISHTVSLPGYISFASRIALGKEGRFDNRGLNLLVARMMGQLAGSAGLTNDDFSRVSLRLRVYSAGRSRPIDESDTRRIAGEIRRQASLMLPPELGVGLDGMSLNFLELSDTLQRDFLVSTLAAFAAIVILCSIAFRSPLRGLVALVPMGLGIAATFILMVIFGIPLDMTTIMMSCVAVGVGVDDAIHFILKHRERQMIRGDDPGRIASDTLAHTGRPIILTSLSIVTGMAWFALADFRPIRYFGLLIVFTLTTACLATLLILPPLLSSRRKAKEAESNA